MLTAYTEKQAAEILHCSVDTLQRRRKSGELKEGIHYSRLVRILYSPDHLARIIAGQRTAKAIAVDAPSVSASSAVSASR